MAARRSPRTPRRLPRLAAAASLAIAIACPAVARPDGWSFGVRGGDGDALLDFKEDVHTADVYLRSGARPLPAWLARWVPDWVDVHLDATLSRIRVNDDATTLLAVGPVLAWRIDGWSDWIDWPLRLTLGVQPGLISDHDVDDKELGGPFQFTSHMAAGLVVTPRLTVSLRIHHTSNADFYSVNDGLDAQSLEAELRF